MGLILSSKAKFKESLNKAFEKIFYMYTGKQEAMTKQMYRDFMENSIN